MQDNYCKFSSVAYAKQLKVDRPDVFYRIWALDIFKLIFNRFTGMFQIHIKL